MTRYKIYDDQGRELYRGEVISSRRYVSARRVGHGHGLLLAGSLAGLLILAGVPWILGVMIGALAGQVLTNRLQRRYSREIWRLADEERARELKAEILTPEEKERREAKALRDEKIRNVRISAEADLPFIDYDSGEVWPYSTLADHLAELEADAERHDAIDAVERDLERHGSSAGIIRGRPSNPAAARKARLVTGEIVELTNDDLALIRSMGPGIVAGQIRMPSGFTLSGPDIATLARELRAIEGAGAPPCPHGCPAHRECPYCMIDLGTPEGIRRGRDLIDGSQIESWAAAPFADYPPNATITLASGRQALGSTINDRVWAAKHKRYGTFPGEITGIREARVIERDMAKVQQELTRRHITPETAQSLLEDFRHELTQARRAEARREAEGHGAY